MHLSRLLPHTDHDIFAAVRSNCVPPFTLCIIFREPNALLFVVFLVSPPHPTPSVLILELNLMLIDTDALLLLLPTVLRIRILPRILILRPSPVIVSHGSTAATKSRQLAVVLLWIHHGHRCA